MSSIQADQGDGVSSFLVGDLNIAPLPEDVWSHKQLLKVVSHTPIETERLQALCCQGGWVDLMRMQFPVPTKLYTWWSYRARDWALADRGRRLDHIWSSPDLTSFVAELSIFVIHGDGISLQITFLCKLYLIFQVNFEIRSK